MELVLGETADGCIVPTSHELNKEGYFRKRVDGSLVLYHRHVWEVANGKLPEGYEVDHKCKNRACCNILHLQPMTSSAHRSKDNAERYLSNQEEAKAHWLIHNNTGTSLAGLYGLSLSTACRWIRTWKEAE